MLPTASGLASVGRWHATASTSCWPISSRRSWERARRELSAFNVRTRAIEVDVSDAAAFERAADQAEAEFGNIHFLFNNAGVTLGPAPLWEVTPAQWEWIFGVNIHGVINGIRTLVPRMRRHGEAGHVTNTASIGGIQVNPTCATAHTR